MALKARFDSPATGQTTTAAHYAIEGLGLSFSSQGACLVVRPYASGAARGTNLSAIGPRVIVPLTLVKYGQIVAAPVGSHPNKLAAIRAAATAHLLTLPEFAGATEDTDVDEPADPTAAAANRRGQP